ncbi:MAG: EamA family transporter [Pseudomonadota bacterium]
MTGAAVALALAAAVLHAGWNLLLGGARDVLAATAVAITASLVVAAPFAAATWDVDRDALPWLVASGALELVYFVLLAAAYQRADVSLVYPLARGGAPVLVLCWSLAFGAALDAPEIAGVLAVAAGVVLVRGLGHGDRVGVVLGLVIAAFIAAYTLVDNQGIRHAAPVPYLLLALVPTAVGAALLAGPRRMRGELRTATVVAGCAGFLAYTLVLAALRLAPAAPVAAVRETSVLFAVLLAAPVLREPVGRVRIAGAALVVVGVLALSA